MTREEAYKVLVKMRAWRKWGNSDQKKPRPPMPEQKEVDEAFDVFILTLAQPQLPSGLDEAAEESARAWRKNSDGSESREIFFQPHIRGFKAGAKWDAEQFEKNRLAACEGQTKEEYDREVDFATQIIEKEHRQPTFSDAINYGMKLMSEQGLKKECIVGVATKEIVCIITEETLNKLGVCPSDKVIIQIRKVK